MERSARPFNYSMREKYPSISTIWKAWFGSKKFLIVKAKSLHQSVNMIAKEIDYKYRMGVKDDDMHVKVIKHIKRYKIQAFEVEAIVQTDNPAELLIEEYKLLKAYAGTEACLNTNVMPHIPNWIPETAVKEFQAFVAQVFADKKKVAATKPKKHAKPKSTKNNKVRSAR